LDQDGTHFSIFFHLDNDEYMIQVKNLGGWISAIDEFCHYFDGADGSYHRVTSISTNGSD
jgi:hypothetical protein